MLTEIKSFKLTGHLDEDPQRLRINRYHLVAREIGEGAYCTVDVYKKVCKGRPSSRLSAVKSFYMSMLRRSQCPVYSRESRVSVESGIFQLSRELSILDSLSGKSEHIVRVQEVIHDPKWQRVVIAYDYCGAPIMNYVELKAGFSAWIEQQGSLYVQRSTEDINAFVEEDAIECLKQLMDALSVIHASGVVHKDLKPENILLNFPICRWISIEDKAKTYRYSEYQHGRPLQITVCDFNTSEFSSDGLIYDAQGSTLFSPPEVFGRIDRSEGIDGFKRDMWSVGIIAACMLTGYVPVESGHRSLEFQIKLMELQESGMNHLDVSGIENGELWRIVQSLLSIDVLDRPSAKEVLHLVNQL